MELSETKTAEKRIENSLIRCTECGGTDFIVNESEIKTVNFVISEQYPFISEQIVSSEGEGYDNIICKNCMRNIAFFELIDQQKK